MDDIWNRENVNNSLLRTAFSWTPYEGWDSTWGTVHPPFRDNPQLRRLLELEWAIRPVPLWVQQIVRQIEQTPPCGACFVQHVEAVCRNIGLRDACAVATCSCYSVGQPRLHLLARFCVCLDGWLKQADAPEVAAALLREGSGGRDWRGITQRLWQTLGAPTPVKVLLVRRLIERLRFWIRAPYGAFKLDDSFRMGYYYEPSMGKNGGWDYFAFDRHDPEVAELASRIGEMPGGKRWLELMNYTWPCAPKVFRFLERIIAYIGATHGAGAAPNEKLDVPGFLDIEGTYLSSNDSRGLYATALTVLADFTAGQFDPPGQTGEPVDERWKQQLIAALGQKGPESTYLAALFLERLWLLRNEFRSFHFTRNVGHASH